MPVKKNFLDRFIERVEDVDANSRQAYILRLARERGFFETVFNAVEEGILVLDSQLRIRYFNRAAKDLLALPDDMENVRISRLIPGMDWKRVMDQDADAWARLSRQEVEITYPRQTFLQLYLVPHEQDADLATLILRDVTESRKRTLDDLEQQTAQAVSMLAAGVAHEIGNPLNSLYLNLQLLEKPENLAPGEAADMIRDCKHEVERLDNILASFLAAIRPGKPQFEPVDLHQLVLETITFMHRELESRRISVNCRWPEKPLPRVNGDPQQLKQAFFNIIKNALQAMTAGGELQISACMEEEHQVLAFADKGQGMTKEQLGDMFTPFKTSKATGNGLGMMIIQRVCREHGAEFGVDSKPEEGTTVSIRFPLGRRRIRVLPPG
ncbi:MAG: PAS domain-containing protein [Lentisphaeria bacterium]|nr:PAS domain-containing protein [Lentisphaeria bacterium]